MPQGGMPQRSMRPSRPELHSHLKQRPKPVITTEIIYDNTPASSQIYKEGKLTAAPTDRANVPNISDTGISPSCQIAKKKKA